MTPGQEAAYERLLTASLARISDAQRFGEAKNAALLTFCSAWIVGSINMLFGTAGLPDFARIAMSLCLPIFVLSAAIAIFSFLPKLSPRPTGLPEEKNLLFFGHLRDLADPVNDLGIRYACAGKRITSDNMIADMCNQICTNSEIAHRKFQLFNLSVSCLALTLAATVASAIFGAATTKSIPEFLAYLGVI